MHSCGFHMKDFWNIDGDCIKTLQGNSAEFVRLLNNLIATEMRAAGVPDSAVHLTQGDSTPDGGVDAVVDQRVLNNQDATGRFRANLLAVQSPTYLECEGEKEKNY